MKPELEFKNPADIERARRAIVDVCARMYARGTIVASDGNVSVRVVRHRMLITPSGARKAFLTPESIILCDLLGIPARGERGRPSSEIAMHALVYQTRPDVMAVVHAHPPFALAHTIAGIGLSDPIVPEAWCALGPVPTVGYATPTTDEVPQAIGREIETANALLLERHGSLTLGRTLAEAYDRLEILEHTAKISWAARCLAPAGRIEPLSRAQLDGLRVHLGCPIPE